MDSPPPTDAGRDGNGPAEDDGHGSDVPAGDGSVGDAGPAGYTGDHVADTGSTGGAGPAGDRNRAPDRGRGADYDDPIGGLLPYASVDSNWWYWIAAPTAFFLLSLVGGLLFFLGFLVDTFLTGGVLAFGAAVVFGGLAALVGLVLSVLFPVAVYVDARALSDAPESPWSPDPLLYGLVALAGVVVTAFTVSVPFGIYYLYRRHVAVGTP